MPETGSSHQLYRFLPIMAGIAGTIPAGILHRGLGVGPYISIAVGMAVALAIFYVLDEREKQNGEGVRP